MKMFSNRNPERNRRLPAAVALLLSSVLVAVAPATLGQDKADTTQERTFDNLVAVEGAAVNMAFIDPDADFSVFKRVSILEPFVAFRSNWQRDQNRSRSRNIRARDMERIKEDVATQFERVFAERLEAAGYDVVEVAGDDVLVLRPAIIDLDITAPDTRTAGRSRTFTASTRRGQKGGSQWRWEHQLEQQCHQYRRREADVRSLGRYADRIPRQPLQIRAYQG